MEDDNYKAILDLPDLPKGADYKRVSLCERWDGIVYIGDQGFCRVRYEGVVYRNRVKTRSNDE